jgi:hypothetical protein
VITGKATQGNSNVSVNVIALVNFTIQSPQNITYNFTIGEAVLIELNVSILNDSEPEAWWFTLIQLSDSTVLNDSSIFTPNISIHPGVGQHSLTVYANNSAGAVTSKTVLFNILANNTAPAIEEIESQILVCENKELTYAFNVTDIDGDSVTLMLSNLNPFFLWPDYFSGTTTAQNVTLYSVNLNKNYIKFGDNATSTYAETIFASDSGASDSKSTNITIIEVNNVPEVRNVTTRTVWAFGENKTFYEAVSVNDTEDGNQNSGNFTFNLTFPNGVTPFFNITTFGVINFTANSTYLGADNASVVYNLSLCVIDNALKTQHPNISLCSPQIGGNQTVCQNFSLTVTAQNRAPRIISHVYSELVFTVLGTSTLSFDVTKTDSDGTIPDAYWYVDSSFKERDAGASEDKYSYAFGCGVSGLHTVKAEITDGELNDSVQWNITVQNVECPVSSGAAAAGGGGGGGGRAPSCKELWACDVWNDCQNIAEGLETGIIRGENYRRVKEGCAENEWNEIICGYQVRVCVDVHSCNSSFEKPADVQACYFTEHPDCSDGIKNCHDEGCEFLTDCGGPCSPCPSCSDGIKNQGEKGIDCGSPCSEECAVEKPSHVTQTVVLSVTTGVVLVTILVIKLYQIFGLGRLFGATQATAAVTS